MKKVLFIIVFLIAVGSAWGQNTYADYNFKTLDGDTDTVYTIVSSDMIEGLSIFVTTNSTDSCAVYGSLGSYWLLGPGESTSVGYPGAPVNYMYIDPRAGCVARVATIKKIRKR